MGDEFTVLVEELHDPSDAVRIAERIQTRLALPFEAQGQEIVVSASIGLAFSCSNSRTEAEDMLRDSEIAMYRAKQAGKAHCEVFDNVMHAAALRRLKLETDLRRALELGEFRCYYQPIVLLSSGQIVGFEALTRWHRPDGVVMPVDFIAVADEIGVILPINRQLLQEACEQLRAWHELFPSDPPLTMAVNVTPRQLAQPDLASQIGDILRESGMDPHCVDLEITETNVMADPERSTSLLSDLKALGIRVSIDDFGTGYSSLSRLQRLPVDTLKIDRSFISGIGHDAEAREIVRITTMLAQNLRLNVVAEGVESREQSDLLTQLGCEFAQGYLFCKPAVPETIHELLIRNRAVGPCNIRAKAAARGDFPR